jgi:hypothetical protein
MDTEAGTIAVMCEGAGTACTACISVTFPSVDRLPLAPVAL